MRLFIVKEIGSYALNVEVHRAESEESLRESLPPLDNLPFYEREIIEIIPEGIPGKIFGTCAIE